MNTNQKLGFGILGDANFEFESAKVPLALL